MGRDGKARKYIKQVRKEKIKVNDTER